MKKSFLNINNLNIKVEDSLLLKDINFSLKEGDILTIIGPNGAGKSSLLKTIMHHYAFKVKGGSINYNGKSLLKLSTDQIAKLGFFYLAQNPQELEGVKLIDLYKIIANAHTTKRLDPISLHTLITPKFNQLNLDLELLKRSNNVNFSGGQKKKNELVQMFLTNNKVLLLDEVDSGCDVDSLKIIAKEINKVKRNKIIILVSHQKELLKMIKPNKFITIANKTIVKKGNGKQLFKALDAGFKKYLKPSKKSNFESLKNAF